VEVLRSMLPVGREIVTEIPVKVYLATEVGTYMLLAKDVVAVEDAFVGVLEHIPGTKSQKQEYFLSRNMRVPRTNYKSMWEVLTGRLHHSGAASVVFECLLAYMPGRLKELLQLARSGRAVSLRTTEPAIVWDFFFENGNLRRVGDMFLQDLRERGGALRQARQARIPVKPAPRPYEIALSFAGENRPLIEQVAEDLRFRGVKVFYDRFEEVNLLGKDLAAHFAEIYGKQASYCAMFISEHYVRKGWPQHERRHAQARALAVKREYILPLRLDDSEVPGLPSTIGYISIRGMTPKAIAEILFRKIRGG